MELFLGFVFPALTDFDWFAVNLSVIALSIIAPLSFNIWVKK